MIYLYVDKVSILMINKKNFLSAFTLDTSLLINFWLMLNLNFAKRARKAESSFTEEMSKPSPRSSSTVKIPFVSFQQFFTFDHIPFSSIFLTFKKNFHQNHLLNSVKINFSCLAFCALCFSG